MNKKHQPFMSKYGCSSVQLCNESDVELTMCINNTALITKQEVMDFFGLMEKPEPEKPIHADLIKAFANGAVIEYRYSNWAPDHWKVLNSTNTIVVSVFMSNREDPEWSFRIKPE